MVRVIEESYRLRSLEVSDVMMKVPRHRFAPYKYWDISYDDCPIDIGYGQTMSQPYTVAFMTHLALDLKRKTQNKKIAKRIAKNGKILEIGTGSGYQAAILSYFFDEVYTLEIVPQLTNQAGKIIEKLGYKNVFIKSGSGILGWKEHSPYDAIMITAGVEKVPEELFAQLKNGGVLIVPVGEGRNKVMTRYIKSNGAKQADFQTETFGVFHFVPFVEKDIRG